eukprot:2969998-Amphidinium_carterae.1
MSSAQQNVRELESAGSYEANAPQNSSPLQSRAKGVYQHEESFVERGFLSKSGRNWKPSMDEVLDKR